MSFFSFPPIAAARFRGLTEGYWTCSFRSPRAPGSVVDRVSISFRLHEQYVVQFVQEADWGLSVRPTAPPAGWEGFFFPLPSPTPPGGSERRKGRGGGECDVRGDVRLGAERHLRGPHGEVPPRHRLRERGNFRHRPRRAARAARAARAERGPASGVPRHHPPPQKRKHKGEPRPGGLEPGGLAKTALPCCIQHGLPAQTPLPDHPTTGEQGRHKQTKPDGSKCERRDPLRGVPKRTFTQVIVASWHASKMTCWCSVGNEGMNPGFGPLKGCFSRGPSLIPC